MIEIRSMAQHVYPQVVLATLLETGQCPEDRQTFGATPGMGLHIMLGTSSLQFGVMH
jgi:hypothetical protein